ncbi:MAG TPA: NAD(P)-binding domain-containing protein [Polyangiaceae bacterium]|jgi:hypothetical protein|nr:NAD(P)-binding domain-containing protein [Polyangiaceae bacterium]
MKIGILGTGMVGETIGAKLVSLGHDVRLGARSTPHDKAAQWVATQGKAASYGTLADAAEFGELVFNCTKGTASLDALARAGAANLDGKILIDVANPLVFPGRAPGGGFDAERSLGEQIQAAFPKARVVKALNTVNCQLMVDPSRLPGAHDIFVSGDDPQAKDTVARLLREWFGWKSVVDLGDIKTAHATELYLSLWLALWRAAGTSDFNIHLVRGT